MHIAYLIDEMIVGGAQRQIQGLVKRLPDDWQASILCLEQLGAIGEVLQREGVQVHAFGCPSITTPLGFARLARVLAWLRRERPDVLHAYLGTACLVAPWLARLSGARCVTSRRDTGFWMSPLFRRAARWSASRADIVTANSAVVAEATARLEGVPREQIQIIPNAVALPSPLPAPQRRGIREQVGCTEQTLVFCQVATLKEVKDHGVAIAALERLCADTEERAICWWLVGDGPLSESLKADVARRGLESHVRFLGERDNSMRLLQAADVCVLTSRAEGFPNAVLEGMAAGRAILSTDCGGVRDLMEDGLHGRLVAVGDGEALARAALELVRDADLRQRMGVAGAERVAREFTWKRLLDTTLRMYRRLANEEDA